jgi:aminoglycoside phosphotransferase (APT) family kinase protein
MPLNYEGYKANNYLEESPTKLSAEQVTAILERCFGSGTHTFAFKELEGGTFNETYLIEISEKEKVILRVAPPPSAETYWDDVALMRREHNTLPFFAAIASLIPKTLLADFTHQIAPRDYVLQTYLEGDRWSDIEDELTEEENIDLWQQCGEIVKRIHGTKGVNFGYPYPGRSFANWHDVILDRFSRIVQNLKEYQADISHFPTIVDFVHSNQSMFNELNTPHLLHGDLWTFNLLVTRKEGRPIISGVLDTERTWWGDPLADWIMFCLSIRSEEEEWRERISAFYQGYDVLEKSRAIQFRQEVYNAMHIGSSVIWSVKHGNREDIERGREDLRRIANLLPKLLI